MLCTAELQKGPFTEMTIWKDASCGLQCDIHDFKALIALLTWKHLGGKPRWMTLHDEIG